MPVAVSDVVGPGKVAVVTGASSGIGRAMARKFAAVGMRTYLVDVDEAEVRAAAAELSGATAVVVDVADDAAVEALAERVFAEAGACHVLVNNAGVGRGGGALAPASRYRATLGVNTFGPIHGCLAFVPRMRASGEKGLVVNTGSKQGITMPPGNLAYNVSKAALKAYTEGLEHELRTTCPDTMRAALLIPGWVNTSIMCVRCRRRVFFLATDADDDDDDDALVCCCVVAARRLKSKREQAREQGEAFDPSSVFFHEAKPAAGAWMPEQVVDFMLAELDRGRFYIVCPDAETTRHVDNLRMQWTMGDIVEDRPPLSRWHPDYKAAFADFLAKNPQPEEPEA